MSYVFAAAVWGKGVYLVADKRVCKRVNGLVVPESDDIFKIMRINEKLIMGYAGDMLYDTKIFGLIRDISDMGVIYPSEMASNISGHHKIIEDRNRPERLQIIIAGIEEDGSPALSVVDGYNDNLVTDFRTGDYPKSTYQYLDIGVGRDIEKEAFESDLRRLLSNPQSESFEKDLYERVDAHIVLISKSEVSVSATTDHLSLSQ